MTKYMQFAPDGLLNWVPAPTLRFLADAEGNTRGWGWGPGVSVGFGTEHGDLYVLPGQWLVKHDDGTFSVAATEDWSNNENHN